MFLNGFAGTTFNFYDTGLPQFSLGGSRILVAYGTNELLMDKYFLFQLGYLRKMATLPPLLGSGVYFLGMYEASQVYGPPHSMINKASGFPTDGAAGYRCQHHLRTGGSCVCLRRHRPSQVLLPHRTVVLEDDRRIVTGRSGGAILAGFATIFFR